MNDHSKLRAALALIELACAHKDDENLLNIELLADSGASLSKEESELLRVYVLALAERLQNSEGYFIYDEVLMKEAELKLRKLAYGQAGEAFMYLERDFLSSTVGRRDGGLSSGIFRLEYFDKKDQRLWRQWFSQLKDGVDDERAAAITQQIRHHMQKYFGPPIEVATISYQQGAKGISVRACLLDGELGIDGEKAFVMKLKSAMGARKPKQLSEDIFPAYIDEYERTGMTRAQLFRHEL